MSSVLDREDSARWELLNGVCADRMSPIALLLKRLCQAIRPRTNDVDA